MTWLELIKSNIYYVGVFMIVCVVLQKYMKKPCDLNTQQKFAFVSLTIYFLVMRVLAEIYHWPAIINYIVCFIGFLYAVCLSLWHKKVS